jgi:hypothetical protein
MVCRAVVAAWTFCAPEMVFVVRAYNARREFSEDNLG